jgi:hypothetical protein
MGRQTFWSRAAKDSEWVRKEVERARLRQGENGERPPQIIPIIIEGPPLGLPRPSSPSSTSTTSTST